MVSVGARGAIRSTWKKTFKEVVGTDLAGVAQRIIEAYTECMERAQAEGPAECLKKAAKEAGLGDAYRQVYGEHKAELKGKTTALWNFILREVGDALKNVVKGRIARAYSDCMKRTDISAAECFERAAKEAELGKQIKQVWDTVMVELPPELFLK